MKIKLKVLFIIMITGVLFPSGVMALFPPHDSSNDIECSDCHAMHKKFMGFTIIPHGEAQEALCRTCHNPTGLASGMSDISNHVVGGDMVIDCGACHDSHGPDNSTDPHTGIKALNLKLIRPSVRRIPGALDVTVFQTVPEHYAFGVSDSPWNGICQTCHTGTSYHTNNGSADMTHYSGDSCITCHRHNDGFLHGGGAGGDCIECHGHDAGYEYETGKFSMGAGSFKSHSTHTENDTDDLKGPYIMCSVCHDTDNFPYFKTGTDTNGDGKYDITETDVCAVCHSPGGAYDGVNDPGFGAKNNWDSGIYDNATQLPIHDFWCAGCHDTVVSTVQGVNAPPVAGDSTTWGYFASGHGRGDVIACTDCHDVAVLHIDGVADSYDSSQDNYREAYRLSLVNGQEPLVVPRYIPDSLDAYTDPPYYELCFSCHDRYALLGGPTAPAGPYYDTEMRTNFRNDASVIIPDGYGTDIAVYSVGGAENKNSHYTHLAGPPHFFDSDRDGTNDSFGTCVACHNVHGSTSPAMVRDGKLIGFEPALNFKWVRYDRQHSVVGTCAIMTSSGVTGPMSYGGVMRSNSGQTKNGICSFCHCGGANTGDPEYLINCYGPECMTYYREWVTTPVPLTP